MEGRAESALRCLQQLLARDDARSLSAHLLDLAEAMGVTGAGLTAPVGAVAIVQARVEKATGSVPHDLPWQASPELLAEARRACAALELDDGRWLLTTVWHPYPGDWLLWLYQPTPRHWSAGEKAVLPLAAHALARLAASRTGDRWARLIDRAARQHHVEQAAVITGRLAHDFGNVLTGILGFAELSLSQIPGDSQPRRYLQEVLQSAKSGAAWVQKLQTFSRRSRSSSQPTSVAPVIEAEAERLRKLWGPTISLLVAAADELPPVALDVATLRQLLSPLLDNAHEALDGPGVVTISARQTELSEVDCLELIGATAPGRCIEITITDTGRGLTPDVRRRLFADMFFSTKKRQRGLGLAVAYGIVQAFGGGLRFGPDPEQGTAVHVFLPAAHGAPAPVAVPAAPASPVANILVVDDDDMVLESMCVALEKAGHRVKAAPGPYEALACFTSASEPFHLVLSDVLMPKMSGIDLVRRLLEHDRKINALFISAHESGHGGDDLVRQFGVLRKPFEPAALVSAVNAALARRSAPN